MTSAEPLIPRGRADLWLLDESVVETAAARYGVLDLMSPAERTRHERLRSAKARRQHLGGRLLTRYVLAAYTGLPPDRLSLTTGRFGRPELDPNPHGLLFNLSHTGGLLAFVLTRDQPCGLDVERAPLPDDVVQALLRLLAPDERAEAERGDPPERARSVLRYWVVKEAYLKALGVGLARSVDSFTVRGPDGSVRVEDPEQPPGAAWQVELLQPSAHHMLAVALARPAADAPPARVRVFDFGAYLDAVAAAPPGDAPRPLVVAGGHGRGR